MAKGGRMPSPTGFSNFSREWEEFLQTKFLAVASSLGHLSMKKFSDWTFCLGSKIRQREGAGGWQHPHGLFFLYFQTMKMTFNLNQFWYEVR